MRPPECDDDGLQMILFHLFFIWGVLWRQYESCLKALLSDHHNDDGREYDDDDDSMLDAPLMNEMTF